MVTIRRIWTEETLPLRSRLLREGRPHEQCRFAQDDLVGTFHLGALIGGELVGVATFCPVGLQDLAGRGYQLRGMAVEPHARGTGVGRLLLLAGEERLSVVGDVDYLWCNARLAACGFYARHGFVFLSEEFEIPEIGPHRRMVKWLRGVVPGLSAGSS
jgi:GNAT superfamily N-acetyltransferase